MKLLKRIASFLDVERELRSRYGVEITQTFVIAGQTYEMTHGLGRIPRGWKPIDKDVAEAGFGRTAWDNNTITLYSNTGNVTAKFEVY